MRITRQQRQKLIAQIISESRISNQQQLVNLLAQQGVDVTQSTLSRDLEEMAVAKVRDGSGEPVYAISGTVVSVSPPEEALRRVLREWVAGVDSSGNLVVVHTPPGCAHVVAAALDRSRLEEILGTVAGDDTILLVARGPQEAIDLAGRLSDASGLRMAAPRLVGKKDDD